MYESKYAVCKTSIILNMELARPGQHTLHNRSSHPLQIVGLPILGPIPPDGLAFILLAPILTYTLLDISIFFQQTLHFPSPIIDGQYPILILFFDIFEMDVSGGFEPAGGQLGLLIGGLAERLDLVEIWGEEGEMLFYLGLGY